MLTGLRHALQGSYRGKRALRAQVRAYGRVNLAPRGPALRAPGERGRCSERFGWSRRGLRRLEGPHPEKAAPEPQDRATGVLGPAARQGGNPWPCANHPFAHRRCAPSIAPTLINAPAPRTPQGKARVALSALRHGGYAVSLPEKLLRAADRQGEAQYRWFRREIAATFGSGGRRDERQADQMAARAWCVARRMGTGGTKPECSLDSVL